MAERDHITTTPYTSFDRSSTPDHHSAASPAFERSSDEIRQHIAATRESITETVDELSSRVQRTFDWKTYVADYPLAAAGVAAGLGVMVGYLAQPRPTPKERIHAALAEMLEDTADRFQAQFNDMGIRRPGFGRALRALVITTLVQKAGDFARNKFAETNRLHEQEGEGSYSNNTETAYRTDPRQPFGY